YSYSHAHVDAVYLSGLLRYTVARALSTLSLHDALPISPDPPCRPAVVAGRVVVALSPAGAVRSEPPAAAVRPALAGHGVAAAGADRKSTRLNSSHVKISYAVFCLKKKIDPPLALDAKPA